MTVFKRFQKFAESIKVVKMERMKASLRKTIEKNKEANIQIKSDDEYFLEEFTKVNLKGSKKATNDDILPKFYSGLPAETDELKQKLREEARAQFLQRRSRSLLDNEELKKLYSILEAQSVPPEEEFSSLCEDNLLNYEQFLKAKEESSEKCQKYFKVQT